MVEDVVHDALAIVFEKTGAPAEAAHANEPPALPWCFQVLRNVIGNLYQKERTRARASNPESEMHARLHEFSGRALEPTPMESLERRERSRLLREAIDTLAAEDDFCGKHFRELLHGSDSDASRSAAAGSNAATSTFHVRLFRCRKKLKAILMKRGYLP
ncbi:MAG: hypothetical protein ACKVU1_05610 [bacterium]